MANRNRPIQVKFRVTPEERLLIDKRMEQAGTMNMAAYLRKMAIDGYVVKLELPELRDMISLLRRTSNNFNQIARRVNSTDRIYAEDIHDMKGMLEQIWETDNRILEKLAAID
ncbi:plasmid mobilization protein [Allobaculum stercoricanis]|uniref:plasmid mobilization protein n=1 Tax=Allobaculum stercoricanis TaxID=174709 RepID=UPI00035D761F|nr:plasmid mobilization relaxosome protein MobC [Allobaculum stercoricanis]